MPWPSRLVKLTMRGLKCTAHAGSQEFASWHRNERILIDPCQDL